MNILDYKNTPEFESKLISFVQRNFHFKAMSAILEYSNENTPFFINNHNLLKKTIENALSYKTINTATKEINHFKSNILDFFIKAIPYPQEYDNEWLSLNINNFFKLKMPLGKDFNSKLDNLKSVIGNVQFSQDVCPLLDNFIKDNSCIILHEPITFHCDIHTSKLGYQLSHSQLYLIPNIKTGLKYLKNIIDNHPEVCFSNDFTNGKDSIFSVIVLHKSQELKKKLPLFIDYLCYHLDHRSLLKEDNMETFYFKFNLENDLKNNDAIKPSKI